MATRLFALIALALGDYLSARVGQRKCLLGGSDSEYEDWYAVRARSEVREETAWVWSHYRDRAMGADSILPEDGVPIDDWGGFNMFLADGLGTLKVMGFEDWFQEGVKYLKKRAYYRRDVNVNVMETTIRVLGGLLSAYEMSPDPALLRRCVEVGDRLAFAFTLRGALPYTDLNMETGDTQLPRNLTGLSEMGTLSLEFRKLSELTGNQTYADLVDRVERFLLIKVWRSGGLVRYEYDPYLNDFVGRKCVGAREDSYYEYLYKVWLLTGRQKHKYRKVYEMTKNAILNTLLERSFMGEVYLKEIQDNGEDAYILEHLTCFYPGLLALEGIAEGFNATQERIAESIAKTCVELYERSLQHLAPDLVAFPNNYELFMPRDYANFHLRPETVESLFYLYRLTKKQYYRDAAYSIFAAMRKNAKAEYGYSSVKKVNGEGEDTQKLNEQQSYFLAETMKYLYLVFSPVCTTQDSELDLSRHILTTEGHILRIPQV